MTEKSRKEKIKEKAIEDYKSAISQRVNKTEPDPNDIWIIENVVDITVKEIIIDLNKILRNQGRNNIMQKQDLTKYRDELSIK